MVVDFQHLLVITLVLSPLSGFFERWKRSRADAADSDDVVEELETASLNSDQGGEEDSPGQPQPPDVSDGAQLSDEPQHAGPVPASSESTRPNGAEAVSEPPDHDLSDSSGQGHEEDAQPEQTSDEGFSAPNQQLQEPTAGDEATASPLFRSSFRVPEPPGIQSLDSRSTAGTAPDSTVGDDRAIEGHDLPASQPSHRVSRLQVETIPAASDRDEGPEVADWQATAGLRRIVGLRTLEQPSLPVPARVWPKQHRGARYWTVEGQEVLGVTVFTEKSLDRGEDAEPTWMFRRHDGGVSGLLAVYDGLGGAGSRLAVRDDRGQELNQAYVASRLVRSVTEQWEAGGRRDGIVGLAEHLDAALSEAVELLAFDETRTVSNLRRKLPTTIAAATLKWLEDRLTVEAIWAGDSRVFVLSATEGLQQITRDHARSQDILEQLINDSPMSSVVCADRPTSLAVHEVQVSTPAVILATTDGVHGYVKTPGQVESLLLTSLLEARNCDEWATILIDEISAVAADDATLTVAALGYASFENLQTSFAERAESVVSTQVLGFQGTSRDEHEAFAAARRNAWESYREGYEARIPPVQHLKIRRDMP